MVTDDHYKTENKIMILYRQSYILVLHHVLCLLVQDVKTHTDLRWVFFYFVTLLFLLSIATELIPVVIIFMYVNIYYYKIFQTIETFILTT